MDFFKIHFYLCNKSWLLLFELLSFLPVMIFLFRLKLDSFCLYIDPGLAFVQNDVYLEGRS